MKKYTVHYYDNSGDYCHVWVMARNKEHAIDQVRDEYWDIQKIIEVEEC